MATVSYEVNGITQVIFFDTTIGEQHNASSSTSDHEVEKGADVSDHIKVERDQVTLEVMVTNTPITSIGRLVGSYVPTVVGTSTKVTTDPRSPGTISPLTYEPQVSGGYTAPFRVPGTPRIHFEPKVIAGRKANETVSITANLFTFLTAQDRVKDVWTALHALQQVKTLFQVATALEDYSDMVLTSLGAPVTSPHSIRFSLGFRKFGFVESLSFSGVAKVQAAFVATAAAEPVKDEGAKAGYVPTGNKKESVLNEKLRGLAGYRTPDEVAAGLPIGG